MSTPIVQLHTIQAPQLSDANFGDNMSQQFNNINDNFSKLASAEFLKGTAGDNISVVGYDLNDPSQSAGIVDALKNALSNGHDNSSDLKDVNGYRWTEGITGIIYLIYEDKLGNVPRQDWSANLVGSLPYTYLDPRFNNQLVLNEDGSNYKDAYDLSCILVWDSSKEVPGFSCLDAWPTLYFDEDKFQFCWRIHGKDTGLVAQGPQGRDGRSGNMLVVRTGNKEAIADGEALSNIYVITHYLPDITSVQNPDATWEEFTTDVIQTLGYSPIGCTAMVFQYDTETNQPINDRYWLATISNRYIGGADKYVVSLSDFNMVSTAITKTALYNGLSTFVGDHWGGLFLPIQAETHAEDGSPLQPVHMAIAYQHGNPGTYNELHLLPLANKSDVTPLNGTGYKLTIVSNSVSYDFTLTGVSYSAEKYTYNWAGGGNTCTSSSLLIQDASEITWAGHTIDSFSVIAIGSNQSQYPFIIHYPVFMTGGLSVPSLDGCSIPLADIDKIIQNALSSL